MNTADQTTDDLQDILQEFVEAVQRPDAASLEKFVRRYPRYAAELTDFAAEWLLEELTSDKGSSEHAKSEEEASISRALSYLQHRLHDRDKTTGGQQPHSSQRGNLFSQRTPGELQRIMEALGIDKPLMAKVRDRQLEAESIPLTFSQQLGQALSVPLDVLLDYHRQPPIVPRQASFRASRKPEAVKKESFQEAVRKSSMSDKQKAKWRS